jgi:NAD(P)-dependent dehydrogenase (short-subunit alcohol dehydrogenase family)
VSFEIDPGLLGLVDRVAIVTGGGAGLGKASSLQLARAGCHIAVVDINEETARQTVAEIEALGRRAIAVVADALDEAAVTSMVDTARSELGPVYVGVNVVGGAGTVAKKFFEMTVDEWSVAINRNLISTFMCAKAEAASMLADRTAGRIINISSSSGIVGAPMVSSYGAANAGVIHFSKSAALELAPAGIRVNCVVPGTHWTEKRVRMFDDPNLSPERKAWTMRANSAPPLGRLGDPAELGGVVLFLASDLSNYMTGHSIISDGGLTHTTARPPVDETTLVPTGYRR